MPNCSVCGEPTQLHVMGKPICSNCKQCRGEQRKEPTGGVRREPY